MPLGMEEGLGPGDFDFVLDGDRAPPPKRGAQPPIFGPCLLWPNGRPSQLLLSSCFTLKTLLWSSVHVSKFSAASDLEKNSNGIKVVLLVIYLSVNAKNIIDLG